MRWHRVGTECVEQQEVEARIRRARELQSAVADQNITIGSTSRNKREEAARYRFYRWINFVERHVMGRVRIGRHCSRPKSEHTEMLRFIARSHHFDDVTYGTAGIVVGEWLAGAHRVGALGPVDCVAMHQLA